MKLLFENWRKYLLSEIEIVDDDGQDEPYDYDDEMSKDKEQLEKQYFSFDKDQLNDIANNIVSLFKKYDRYNQNELKEFNKGLLALSIKYSKAINYIGSGAFRTVVSIGKDLVLKISLSPSYNNMNKSDYKLGTDSELDGIFPRVYLHGGASANNPFDWIVIERTQVIGNFEDEKIIPFFKSSYLNQPKGDEESKAYLGLVVACLERYRKSSATIEQIFPYANPPLADVVLEMLKIKAKQEGYPEPIDIDYQKLMDDFERNSRAFKSIVKVLKKHPRGDPSEMVRTGNCGIGHDGRFVIIDSSIF